MHFLKKISRYIFTALVTFEKKINEFYSILSYDLIYTRAFYKFSSDFTLGTVSFFIQTSSDLYSLKREFQRSYPGC